MMKPLSFFIEKIVLDVASKNPEFAEFLAQIEAQEEKDGEKGE